MIEGELGQAAGGPRQRMVRGDQQGSGIQVFYGETRVQERFELFTHIGVQGLDTVQIILVIGHTASVLLKQVNLQALFFKGSGAKPGGEFLLQPDRLGDTTGACQIGGSGFFEQ